MNRDDHVVFAKRVIWGPIMRLLCIPRAAPPAANHLGSTVIPQTKVTQRARTAQIERCDRKGVFSVVTQRVERSDNPFVLPVFLHALNEQEGTGSQPRTSAWRCPWLGYLRRRRPDGFPPAEEFSKGTGAPSPREGVYGFRKRTAMSVDPSENYV
jgi:hypothetical protein